MTRVLSLILALFLYAEPRVVAESLVQLTFEGGRVWLTARDTTLARVLEEWSRQGDVIVLNGDRLSSEGITLQLEGVPERDAIRVLLRHVPGYILISKSGSPLGTSAIEQIIVMGATTAVQPEAERRQPDPPHDVIPADLTGPLADALHAEIARRQAR